MKGTYKIGSDRSQKMTKLRGFKNSSIGAAGPCIRLNPETLIPIEYVGYSNSQYFNQSVRTKKKPTI